jgi:DNA-binding CsgD family transcriptional regulator
MKGTDFQHHIPIHIGRDHPEFDANSDCSDCEPAANYSRSTNSLERAGQALIVASAKPIIVLEWNHQILARNPSADLMLQSRFPLFDENGRLCCAQKGTAANLRFALRTLENKLAAGMTGGPKGAVALSLQTADCRTDHSFASLWAIPEAALRDTPDRRPAVVLIIAPESAAKYSIDTVVAQSVFGLTPAEGKLAELLMTGSELQLIAATQHLSKETIRAQLRSLFNKTNTHRQSDLVSLLLRLTFY